MIQANEVKDERETLIKLPMVCRNRYCRGTDREGNPNPPSQLDWSAPVGCRTVCIVCGCGHVYQAPPRPKRQRLTQSQKEEMLLNRIFSTAEIGG